MLKLTVADSHQSASGVPMIEITTLSELTIDGKLSLGAGASSKDLRLRQEVVIP